MGRTKNKQGREERSSTVGTLNVNLRKPCSYMLFCRNEEAEKDKRTATKSLQQKKQDLYVLIFGSQVTLGYRGFKHQQSIPLVKQTTLFCPNKHFLLDHRSDGASTSNARIARRRSISITPEISDDIVRLVKMILTLNYQIFPKMWPASKFRENAVLLALLQQFLSLQKFQSFLVPCYLRNMVQGFWGIIWFGFLLF